MSRDEDEPARRAAAGRRPMPIRLGGDSDDVETFGKPLPPVVCIYCALPVQLNAFTSWVVRLVNRMLEARDVRSLGPREVAVCERNGGACMKLWHADRQAHTAKVVREMREREEAERARSGEDRP